MIKAERAESSLPFDIAIAGLGIVGVHQISREAEETIRRCRQTFVVDSGFGIISYLKNICPKVTSLLPLYEKGKSRLMIYRQMAAEVVNAAIVGSPVCFATYGHPLFYCDPTTLIQRAAKLLNLRVETLPGISALDALLVDLGIDVGADGLQMYETTDLLVRRRPIQIDVPCVLWQATIVAEPNHQAGRRRLEEFLRLQDYLLQFYSTEHPVTLILSKTFPLLQSVIETYRLGTLAADLERGPQAGTLYIPPVRRRAIEDHLLFEELTARK
jgi:precorrin-3B methylase